MNRRAALLLLVLVPLVVGAGRYNTTITLDAAGHGDVRVDMAVPSETMARLQAGAETPLGESSLIRQMLADPLELRERFKSSGYNAVKVTQSVTGAGQETRVSARFSNVQALGELSFTDVPGSLLELNGHLGGELAGCQVDLSPVKDLDVVLTFLFPGRVVEKDESAELSHSGEAVTYRWDGAGFLGEPTAVGLRVMPAIEGMPYFWLALMLGITGLALLGGLIVLQRGPAARNAGGKS